MILAIDIGNTTVTLGGVRIAPQQAYSLEFTARIDINHTWSVSQYESAIEQLFEDKNLSPSDFRGVIIIRCRSSPWILEQRRPSMSSGKTASSAAAPSHRDSIWDLAPSPSGPPSSRGSTSRSRNASLAETPKNAFSPAPSSAWPRCSTEWSSASKPNSAPPPPSSSPAARHASSNRSFYILISMTRTFC